MHKLNEKDLFDFIDKIKKQNLDNKNTIIRLNDEIFDTRLCLIKDEKENVFLGIFNLKGSVDLKSIPLTEGLLIKNAQESKQKGIIIMLEKGHDQDIFLQFILYITNELFQEMTARKTSEKLFKTLSSWQGFFNTRRRPISRNNQLGLMGELKVLEYIVLNKIDHLAGLNSWQGPNNGLHDFVLRNCNLEVKSSSDRNNNKFMIHGEKQLDDIPEKKLFLINPIFELKSDGFNLYEYVIAMKEKFQTDINVQIFNDIIHKAGFRNMHKNYYKEEGLRLKFLNFVVYKIDDNFPRIISKNSPKDIVVNTYSINSDACKNSIIDTNEIEVDRNNGY